MCTVSWLHTPHGFHLLCNRDEKPARARAVRPRVWSRHGVRCLAPTDPDGGGAWIGVNEYGLALCLLNAYPEGWRQGVVSRGRLVTDLLPADSIESAERLLRRMDLSVFSPFRLLFLQPGAPASVAVWEGASLAWNASADSLCPLTASSREESRARAERHASYVEALRRHGGPSIGALRAFHSAGAACVHRDDAATVSFSHVAVSRSGISFLYSPCAPCESDFQLAAGLERRIAPVATACAAG